jgi:uncharacterized protein YaaR (DUF327 family)
MKQLVDKIDDQEEGEIGERLKKTHTHKDMIKYSIIEVYISIHASMTVETETICAK